MNNEVLNTAIPIEDLVRFPRPLKWTPDMHDCAHMLSEYVSGLPLTREQNNRLVHLMVEHVFAVEQEAFYEGAAAMRDRMRKGEVHDREVERSSDVDYTLFDFS